MGQYTYRLPWPPSVNTYWGTRKLPNGTPMKYLTFKARQFRAEVSDIVTNCPTGAPRTLLGRLGVLIELTPPTRRRLDIDNFCKSTVDALMHAGVFVDDEQIDELRVKRLHVEPPGCCDVVIQELE